MDEDVTAERDRLLAFCQRLEQKLLRDGDPFSGDDWSLMQAVRAAMGKQDPIVEYEWSDRTTTEDWLATYQACKTRGENPADSVFWRLALMTLPLGVNPIDPRVEAAIAEIAKAVDEKE